MFYTVLYEKDGHTLQRTGNLASYPEKALTLVFSAAGEFVAYNLQTGAHAKFTFMSDALNYADEQASQAGN